jgi:putative ABC transport system ATP-binding protein
MALLQELNRQGMTVVLVTHEHDIADFASRLITFRDGHVTDDRAVQPVDAQSKMREVAPA